VNITCILTPVTFIDTRLLRAVMYELRH